MRSTLRPLTLGLSIALILGFSIAAMAAHDGADTHKERRIKIVACDGGEVTDLGVEDLTLGETREITTSCGKVVSITRSPEDEIRVAIDGKVLDLLGADGDSDSDVDSDSGGGDSDQDSDSHRKVIVRKHRVGDCGEGEDCETRTQVRKIVIQGDEDLDSDALALLGEELSLDCEDGDEECHAEILRLLDEHEGDGDGERVVVIKKRVRGPDEDHDTDHSHDHDHDHEE